MVAVAVVALTATTVPGSWAAGHAAPAARAASHKPPGNPKAFRFAAKEHGRPVHWNKCRAIDYRLSKSKTPAHALPQLKHAIKLLHRASGLRFRYLGRTRIIAGNTNNYPGKTRLVVSWSTRAKSKLLHQVGGSEAGVGGARFSATGEIFQGQVVLNRKVKLSSGFGRGPKFGTQGTIGQLLLHELGHAVGLAHVKDRHQIMYPILTRKLARYGAGDRNGLARVGRKRACF